jgi:4-amino-4-deoxy-L-arabinose transferase-like glycosyltransferase
MPWRKPHVWLPAALLIYFLYFFHLTTAGMLGPDEPRYASIGREMARSGDWITPRLWGEPWFEKPALLYWMTGIAFRLGLGEDLAPRLPVAVVSVAFLAAFCGLLRRDFGNRAAGFATAILGTCAGWVGLSHAGVTDVPMAAAFSLAALLSLRWIHKGDRNQLSCAAAALGFAVMAKGAVPLVLILPVLWCGRRRWRDLLYPAVWAPFLLVAGPWYLACFLRNGQVFLDQFFWRHHVERFVSDSLQHSQPFWFYLPVLLAGIFPWIALLPLIFRAKAGALLLVAGFGFFFFSVSQNKLPEYLLPLLPSVAALMGIGLAGLETAVANRLLAATAGLAGLAPMAAGILPQALAEGITKSHFSSSIWIWFFPAVLCLAMAAFKPRFAMALVVVTAVLGVVYLEVVSLPMIDEAVSARPVWRQIKDRRDQVCIEKVHRRYRYGLNYYSVTPLPDCSSMEKPLHLAAEGGNRPVLR